MNMIWRGDKILPLTFIPFLMLSSVFIGEVLPLVIAIFGGVFGTYGAKEPIIKSWPDFGLILVIYTVLGSIFWFLYRLLNWRIVAFFAFVLAFILERWVYWHPEGEVGVSNTISFGTIFQLVIIYFLVLVLPYLIFQKIRSKWALRGILVSLLIILLLIAAGLIFIYYTMVIRGLWPWRPVTSQSQSLDSGLPLNTCPERLIVEKDKQTTAYWDGKIWPVSAEVQNWVEKNCPGALEGAKQP
ncbi:MAG: hypothetical protein ACD_38C00171G0005 [uncultured bacterium]|uniref:Uncharacterized protein n=1 Tax=Candidatus Daviesbacteria bacterium GW2011_GWC2_40_12 TaxID=1618431 RepID=A0A0G0T5F3_9BACT|nr:MAG: hypothetical protein ACD_38C00171G0005 [uncultured bacterium]KKQ85812.1 MAG: hypothetical protein UT04_C0001G0024 [Candidatus Daviesbacteria bacterium GW2011_GWF2_38_7]KKR16859.1 MAG: hypothetical protein UT45_C0004G0190 [Candidatus Daviesbacteria bacterium GW2011_GWA2_39_33]KKR22763.1 MAG: hypothetical protein UT54_C0062G0002 [Candidatus Daviesbacteria bacterium GW2011_GWB1_39_5]KKR42360.1 MAG: hypothetical protein UT77_C0002G0013 [Candidatus Daviesbacteria bacterium GW2011_GWC2_40_12]